MVVHGWTVVRARTIVIALVCATAGCSSTEEGDSPEDGGITFREECAPLVDSLNVHVGYKSCDVVGGGTSGGCSAMAYDACGCRTPVADVQAAQDAYDALVAANCAPLPCDKPCYEGDWYCSDTAGDVCRPDYVGPEDYCDCPY